MIFQVTDIEFDFTDDIGDGDTMDDFLTDEYKQGVVDETVEGIWEACDCLLYTSPSPRDQRGSRMPSSA